MPDISYENIQPVTLNNCPELPFTVNIVEPVDPVVPVKLSLLPSNVKLASAFAVFVVPNDVNILLSRVFVIVLNPDPLDPDVPLKIRLIQMYHSNPDPLDPDVPLQYTIST
jgi:hypothetical protein